MAGPLDAGGEVRPPGPREAWDGPLGGAGWALAWIDYGIYSLEHALVVISLITMTLIEFVYILSVYVIEQSITLKRFQDPAMDAEIPWAALVLLGFLTVLLFSVVNNTILGRAPATEAEEEGALRPLPLRIGATVGLLGAVMGFASLTRVLETSGSFYLLFVLMVMGPTLAYFWKLGKQSTTAVLGLVTLVMMYLAWTAPEGFSWADKRALFLLLWVGFLGASMAARQGRHIKLDIARKICPARLLHVLNGLSYLVASAFTGFLVYLGYIYMFNPDYGRFWARTIPGEIPDWLIVAAIPVSFLMISARFLARSVRAFMGYDKPEPEVSETPTAQELQEASP